MPRESLSVALIYQAEQLHQHLRNALAEFGARIVYEAHAREYDASALDASGAHVVIINLDPEVNDEFEALSDLLLDETRRVIFNDGEVTSRLEGWDLARWTRHLAAKVVGVAEVNPPRPEGAEAIPVKVKPVPHAAAQAANEPTPAADFNLGGDGFAAAMSADTGAAMERERSALRTEREAVRPDLIPRPRGDATYTVDPAELTMHLPGQDGEPPAAAVSRDPPTLELPISEIGPAATRSEFPTLELAADALTRAAAELAPRDEPVAALPATATPPGDELRGFDAGGIGFDEGTNEVESLDFIGRDAGDGAAATAPAPIAGAGAELEDPFELTFDESTLAAFDEPLARSAEVGDETPSFDTSDLLDMPDLPEGEIARMPSVEDAPAEDFTEVLSDFGFLDQDAEAPRSEEIMDLDTLLLHAAEAEEEKRKGSLGKVVPVPVPVAKAEPPRTAVPKPAAAPPAAAKPEPVKTAARASEPAKERTLADFEHALAGLSLEPTDDEAPAPAPPVAARAATPPAAAAPVAIESGFAFSLEPIEGDAPAQPASGRAVFGAPGPEPVRASAPAPAAASRATATPAAAPASDDGLSLADFDFDFDENTEIRTDSIVRLGAEPALDDMSVDLDTEIDALLQREASLADDALPGDAASAPKITRVFVLGASIGGPDAVREFLSALPSDVPALFVLAQHMGADFLELMVQQLSRSSKLKVRTVADGEVCAHGDVVIAPLDGRLELDAEGRVTIAALATPSPYTPSIDQVMRDVADRFGPGAGAIIFSGMAHDAIDGARHIVSKGGCVWVQEPSSCVISSMVDGAVEAGIVSYTARPSELARHLVEHCAK